ncbi:PGF-pre-PGF domain-containing protein [Candidatus Woesearchaeota archaeon]|nr:PGF-pre-PGF domain-containing protein [Candidatus Woesearchaeota archaeon]
MTDASGQYGVNGTFKVHKCISDSGNSITFRIQGVSTNSTEFSAGGETVFNITSLGVVCGDNQCNGSETTGSTNVFPECNRDCGATASSSSSSSSGGGGGGGSGGGGGGGAAAGGTATSETVNTGKVISGGTVSAPVSKETIAVTEVKITVDREVTASSVTVSDTGSDKGTATEAVTADSGLSVYKYLKITVDKISNANIKKAVVKFKVEVSSGFDPSTVELRRYIANQRIWVPLPTTLTTQDAKYYYFEAETPGFSQFAIIGKKKEAQTAVTEEKKSVCGNGACDVGESSESCPSDCVAQATTPEAAPIAAATQGKGGVNGRTVAIIALVVIVIAVIILKGRKKESKPF